MRHSYAKEKLGAAVQSMVSDPGDIKTRLWHAFLIFHTLSEKDFSDEYKDEWTFIHSTLTKEEPSYDKNGNLTTGRVENTLKVLDERTCQVIAEKIASLSYKLRQG